MDDSFVFSGGARNNKKITKLKSESLGGDKKNTDIKLNKYVNFNKNNLFTFGDGDGECDYSEKANFTKTHWGQLKLLLSEIQTLVYYGQMSEFKDVVYVGAAPGEHIYVLAQFFDSLDFHLYDIQDFDPRLNDLKNVYKYEHYFQKEDIEFWKNNDTRVFFISDIRSLNYGDLKRINPERAEMLFWKDMKLQESWVMELNPVASLLKFKLPYADESKNRTVSFLDGVIFRQLFQKLNSSETRLLVRGIGYRDWNIENYERKLSYHNLIVREKGLYKNPFDSSSRPIYKSKGLSNDFDSTAMAIILKDYLIKVNQEPTEEKVKHLIDFILDNTTRDGRNRLLDKVSLELDDE